MAVAVAVAVKEGAAVSAESAVVKEGAAMSAVTAAATVKNAPTRWADRRPMKIRQRARTTPAMPMRLQTCT